MVKYKRVMSSICSSWEMMQFVGMMLLVFQILWVCIVKVKYKRVIDNMIYERHKKEQHEIYQNINVSSF